MTEEEIGQQQGDEINALVNSFLKSGRSLTENPQFDAEIKVIVDKYNALRQQAQQQQPTQTQQQTTTQDMEHFHSFRPAGHREVYRYACASR